MSSTGAVSPVADPLAAIRDRAKALFAEGRLRESLAAHDEALALAPHAVVIRLSAAKIAHALELQETSLRHYDAAVQADPQCYPAIEAARRICVGAGLADRAAHYAGLAQRLHPTPEAQIALRMLVPSIIASEESMQASRTRYASGVAELCASPHRLDAPSGEMGVSGFFLAYHGENDRELMTATAQAFLHLIPNLNFTAPHCRERAAPQTPSKKIRIGFISRFFSAHSIFSTSIGLIEHLSRDTFEVIVLRITPSRDDACTARVRAAADRTVNLDAVLYRAREQIAALELDILFYQDIGMEPMSYFLAFSRLARVQCVSFGHPNTTGIPTMDYFISNDAFEPPDADAHYSETLVRLRDLPTLAYYQEPRNPPESADAQSFGLPTNARLYVCPQTLFKLHPDFDEILAGILARDPHAVIVLIAGQFDDFTRALRARFRRTLGVRGDATDLSRRVIFLPVMPFDRFMQLLKLADVILDTPHFNGMNSSLQAFSVGARVVTLPGRFQRGRHTQAMYRTMGITDCVAHDPGDYVDIAVRLATDREYAQALRTRILDRKHLLFEDVRVVAEFERFFLEVARERG